MGDFGRRLPGEPVQDGRTRDDLDPANEILLLYLTRVQPPSLEEITACADAVTVSVRESDAVNCWTSLEVGWPGARMRLQRFDEHHPAMQFLTERALEADFAFDDGQMDSREMLLFLRLLRLKNIIVVSPWPEFAPPEQIVAFVQRFARRECAFLETNQGYCDPEFRLLQGRADHARDAGARLPEFPSALERQARSEERLRHEGLELFPTLPPIVADEETRLRPPLAVATRALVLSVVAGYSDGLDQQAALNYLEHKGLHDFVTPKEKVFLANPHPSEEERIDAYWRYEALYPLLWSLGYFDELPLPRNLSDVHELFNTALAELAHASLAEIHLRPPAEILDAVDLLYRCHWLLREAARNGDDAVEGLNADVVMEWRHALNWLIRHGDNEWDDVQTDIQSPHAEITALTTEEHAVRRPRHPGTRMTPA